VISQLMEIVEIVSVALGYALLTFLAIIVMADWDGYEDD